MLNSILFYFKLIVKNTFCNKIDKAKDKLFLYLTQANAERYAYFQIKVFNLANNNIYLKNNVKFISHCLDNYSHRKYLNLIFNIPNLKIIGKVRKRNVQIAFFDDKQEFKKNAKKFSKTFLIDYDYFSNIHKKGDNILFSPFFMHPLIYANGWHYNIKRYRNNKKNVKIFFSGGITQNHHHNEILKNCFHLLTREEVIKIIRENKKKFGYREIDNNIDYREVFSNYFFNLAFIDNAKYRIKSEEWLPALSKCDFFLALPGVMMPNCHNIIEAMSVGAIPITQYPQYFTPPLKDTQNCIVYKNEKELIEKIEMVKKLPENKIYEMRQNVLNYYDNELDYLTYVNKIKELPAGKYCLYVNAEGLSILAQQNIL